MISYFSFSFLIVFYNLYNHIIHASIKVLKVLLMRILEVEIKDQRLEASNNQVCHHMHQAQLEEGTCHHQVQMHHTHKEAIN